MSSKQKQRFGRLHRWRINFRSESTLSLELSGRDARRTDRSFFLLFFSARCCQTNFNSAGGGQVIRFVSAHTHAYCNEWRVGGLKECARITRRKQRDPALDVNYETFCDDTMNILARFARRANEMSAEFPSKHTHLCGNDNDGRRATTSSCI